MTVSQWLDMWLEEFLGNIKPHTRKSYTGVVNNHIKPMLGEIRLQRLDAVGVQRFVNSLAGITDEEKKLTPKTVKNIHGVLHSALQQAVRIGYIASNPADMTVLPRRKKPEISPLEERQVLSFLEMIQGHRYEYLYITDLFLGLRQSELLGLQWHDIDFDRGHVVVRRQLQYLGHAHGGYQFLDMTKNGKDRCLELPNIVKEALRKQREWQLQMAAKLGDAWINKDDLVFTSVTGDHLKHDHVYRELKRIFKKMGVPNLRFHDLRHTYAVISILAGVDLKTLQENMGHYSEAFSVDTYGHVVERMRRKGADKIDAFVSHLGYDSSSIGEKQ